jgi:pyruvate/2-oxoglutarate dehydrogenase complex dihydrolipoamide dehydrogenase (E3) component
MVVGGGAAGMETARILKLRGHQVSLYEKSSRLGGQLHAASVAPGKTDISLLAHYLVTQLEKLKVDVRLNKEVTIDEIEREKPDVLVLAAGGNQFVPPIPGVDRANVVMGVDLLCKEADIGSRVVIIGGEEVGCEVADFISEDKEKEVTLTSLLPGFSTRGHIAGLRALMNLHGKQVDLVPGVRQYVEINDEGVRIIDAAGAERLLEANTIVLTAGSRANDSLAVEIRNKGLVRYSVFTVGDASEPRSIVEAIHEGAIVAQHI